MRIIRLIAKRKEELKKLAETERNREKFVTSLNKIQEENAQNQFAQGQTIIDLRNKEFDVFRGNEEAMATIKKTLNDKNLKLAELNQQKLIALGSVNLLDESMRAKAKEEIEENFQRKRRQIIADSDEKINQMKDDDVLKQAEREALLVEQTRNFNLMVQDSYMQMFSDIQSAFASLVKSNMDQELKALRRTDKFRAASTEERQNMEDDIKEKFKAQQKLAFRAQQMLQIAQVFMSLNRAIFEIEELQQLLC